MSKCLGPDISVRQHSKSEHWAPCHSQTPSRYDWKIVESNVKPKSNKETKQFSKYFSYFSKNEAGKYMWIVCLADDSQVKSHLHWRHSQHKVDSVRGTIPGSNVLLPTVWPGSKLNFQVANLLLATVNFEPWNDFFSCFSLKTLIFLVILFHWNIIQALLSGQGSATALPVLLHR